MRPARRGQDEALRDDLGAGGVRRIGRGRVERVRAAQGEARRAERGC